LLVTINEQPPIFWTLLDYSHFIKKVWDIIAVHKASFSVKVLQELAVSSPIERNSCPWKEEVLFFKPRSQKLR